MEQAKFFKGFHPQILLGPFLSSLSHMKYPKHCVKIARIRSYSGPHFSRIFPHSDQNNSEYGHFLCSETSFPIIQPIMTTNNVF